MRNSNLILIVTAILVASSTVSAEDLPTKDCGNSGGTMLQINYCAAEQFKLADDKLNSLFKKKMAALETVKVKNWLRDSQRAWISFRDSTCLYEAGPQQESGSVWPLEYYQCMERHTRYRNEDLESYISCDTPDCPN